MAKQGQPQQQQQQETLEDQKELMFRRSRQTRPYDHVLKVIALGSMAVGKTSLLQCYIKGRFNPNCVPSIGVDLMSNFVVIPDGRIVKTSYWDPSGQEQFNSITSSFYRNSQAVLMMYDVTDRESFEAIEKVWLPSLKERLEIGDTKLKQVISMALIGNKSDCSLAERAVTVTEGRALAKKLDVQFYETSAKDNLNVARVVEDLVEITMERIYPFQLWMEVELNAMKKTHQRQRQPPTIAVDITQDDENKGCAISDWFVSTAKWLFGSDSPAPSRFPGK